MRGRESRRAINDHFPPFPFLVLPGFLEGRLGDSEQGKPPSHPTHRGLMLTGPRVNTLGIYLLSWSHHKNSPKDEALAFQVSGKASAPGPEEVVPDAQTDKSHEHHLAPFGTIELLLQERGRQAPCE